MSSSFFYTLLETPGFFKHYLDLTQPGISFFLESVHMLDSVVTG
jgi:hypothetical protein